MLLRNICITLLLCVCVEQSYSDRASTWTFCGCYWDEWEAWSECDSDCFGDRVRTRSVWHTIKTGCDKFTDCATSGSGTNYQECNNVCHNGGSPSGTSYLPCRCRHGYYGSCCTGRVNCGTPDSMVNGSMSVTTTNYGGVARYRCKTYYKPTKGDLVRTCQNDFSWSGTAPECVFAYHCNSSPCKNGARCVNLLGYFRCDCKDGWNGRLCENDVQPPVITNCNEDIHVNATHITVHVSWNPPSFNDPMGNVLDIVSNYPTPSFTFPWGDHTVQYVATKTSNGMSTECTFQVKVRPTPCQELNVPINGARLCNGWKTDYGRFCIVTCQHNFTLGPGNSFHSTYVCGSSGSWIAGSPMPDCLVEVKSTDEALIYQPEYMDYTFEKSCGSDVMKTKLQMLYLERLLSTNGFSAYCTKYRDECTSDNVDVQCGDISNI